jgi:hypothetical protein
MEVHHHSHSVDTGPDPVDTGPGSAGAGTRPTGAGHRKKWSHYFWEFLMLFLAVFCGFIAENIREHKVEHNRVREYARSLVADLSGDTAIVATYDKFTHSLVGYLDSLSDIIGEDRIRQTKGGQLYLYGRFCNGGLQILWHNATFEQVKNSGSLRYFKNISMVKKISQYYAKTKEIDSKYETDLTRIEVLTQLRSQVFNAKYMKPFTRMYFSITPKAEDVRLVDSLMTVDLPLQSYDPALLNQLANFCLTRRLNLFIAFRDYKAVIAQATELIDLLKKEYDIE